MLFTRVFLKCTFVTKDERIKGAKVLSVAESAELLNVSPARVRALVAKGTLPAQKIGRVWTLKEEDVMKRVVQKPRSGRPRANSKLTMPAPSAELSNRLAKTHEAYQLCKTYLAEEPSQEELALIANEREADFRKKIAQFFS